MKTLAGLEIPKRLSHPPVPSSGNLIYSIGSIIYSIDSTGEIRILTNSDSPSGIPDDKPVFIQNLQPSYPGKYIWIQTNINNDPNSFTFWFNDGI